VTPPGETLLALLGTRNDRGISLSRAFVGSQASGGPLARFLPDRRGRALDLYLLLHALAGPTGDPVTLASQVWARALGVDDLSTPEVLISRTWSWLEAEELVATERAGRLRSVRLLSEDGSGSAFAVASEDGDDRFFVPYTYFLGNYHNRINLAGKSVLLASLSLRGGFSFVSGPPASWYGISRDSVKRGLRVLLTLGLMTVESRHVSDPLTTTGYRVERRYVIAPPFAGGGLR
jgi:hypothetical protein